MKEAIHTGFAMLATLFTTALPAVAGPSAAAPAEPPAPVIEMAQTDCNAAAQQVVAQTGGQLLSVSPGPNGSCNVTVLIPGNGNERPRKVTVTVPG